MRFSVATWNILAQAYVVADRYADCVPAAMEPAARRALLLDRVSALNVDVLLLQEVEPDAHEAIARRLGWKGVYAQRRGRPDGASVLTRLPIKGSEVLRYQSKGSQDQVALIVELAEAVVVSTHLQWQPDGTADERHAGRVQLLELLNRVDGRAWIIGGDFNAVPDSSVLREAFSRGFVESSAALTCNANRAPRKLDFLLARGLKATARPLPAITADTALPSTLEPSDHLALAADFEPA
jgi:endonuclease/exonuclease/phosphatase family metal-dependent hydrolase